MGEAPSAVDGLSLRRLLPGAHCVGAADVRVRSCACDSRACRPGDLFVALRGASQDGHDFAAAAVAQGASAVLCERPLPGIAVPQCVVFDAHIAYGLICQALAGQPSSELKVLGVTGTNGKTTSTHLIAAVLEAAGYSSGLVGTLGYFDGCYLEPARLTTPTPPALATWLARMRANGCSHAVVEVSSHALALARLAGVQLDTAAVTNICHDHLDFHKTWENYRDAKARILDLLTPEGMAVLNADDPGSMSLVQQITGPVLTFGIEKPAEVSATLVEQSISHQVFLLETDQATVPVETPLVGTHNVYNCLLATAVGLGQGIDLETIVRGLEAVKRIPGRLDRIECGQPFGVFVDYAHTADALASVLTSLRPHVRGRLICVFGAGGDRDVSKRPQMGWSVETHADLAIITSDNPRSESPADIAKQVLRGFQHPRAAKVVLDRAEAIGQAVRLAQPGDCVLIAGKGHETTQISGDDCWEFDDRRVAEEWLYGRQEVSKFLRRTG